MITEEKILELIKKSGSKGMTFKDLLVKCRIRKDEYLFLKEVLHRCKSKGEITEKKGRFYLARKKALLKAIIKRIHNTYAFAELSTGEEIFIPGRKLKGAITGDSVLIRISSSRSGNLKEGEVVSFVETAKPELCGVVRISRGRAFFIPDNMESIQVPLEGKMYKFSDGDKIIAKVIRRGDSHRDMRVKAVSNFGNSEKALVCCEAILHSNGVTPEFPEEVKNEALYLQSKGIAEKDFIYREDLRNQIIFTIDGADSKDLDDAVSVEKYDDFYILGVHIADVSHYVREKSTLDNEALKRGTSIYYANKVIPMLPKELSNGICSLNPNEDRLSFSAIITLSRDGKILDYDFKKTVIRSRVKGVYSEINEILSGDADEEILTKYKEVLPKIAVMKELSDILFKNRKSRGAPEIETVESKIIVDSSDNVTDILPRTQGESEKIIEEFMLTANEAAASLAKRLEIPFVYRIHEYPENDKLATLKDTLKALGKSIEIKENPEPSVLAKILDEVKGEDIYPIVNRQLLRAMSKAKYSETPVGHYGLALSDYAHFTSPIRRYPDLAIHRILTDVVTKKRTLSEIKSRYADFCKKASSMSTDAEIRAVNIERDCEDSCKAEFMKQKLGETFEGMITSVTSFGFYVMLSNSVEGLVRIESLPAGDWLYDGLMEIKEYYGNLCYRVGDKISVICVGVSVNDGQIDFEIAD